MSVEIKFEGGPARPKRRVLSYTQEPEEAPRRKINPAITIGCFLALAFVMIILKMGSANSNLQSQINVLEQKHRDTQWRAKQKREQLLFDLYGSDWYKYK